jgi:hypothetical protein
VLPLYFTVDPEPGSRNDFLSSKRLDGSTLKSFGVNPGGYVGFYDPTTDQHETFFADDVAKRRAKIKSQVGFARRGIRYKSQVSKPLATGRVPSSRAMCVPLVGAKVERVKMPAKQSRASKAPKASKPKSSKATKSKASRRQSASR